MATETVTPTSSPAPMATASPLATITQEVPTPTAAPTDTKIPPAATEPVGGAITQTITLKNAAELVSIQRLGQGTVLAPPAYSPDGQWLAVPTSIGTHLYQAQTLEEARFIPIAAWQGLMAFSPDGKWLVTDRREGLQIWNPEDGSLVRELAGKQGIFVLELAISPDSQMVAASLDDGTISVWRLASGESIYSVRGRQPSFSPDSQFLVAEVLPVEGETGQVDQVQVYRAVDGSPQSQWDGQRGFLLSDGTLVVEKDGAVRLFNLSKKKVRQAFNGRQVALSADGKFLALLDRGMVRLYQTSDGKLIRNLEGNYAEADYLRFAPDGRTLAGSLGFCPAPGGCITERLITLWKISDGRLIQRLSGPAYLPWLAYSPDGRTFVAAGDDSLRTFNTTDGTQETSLESFSAGVAGMAFSPDGWDLATASGFYHTVRIWDLSNGQLIQRMQDPSGGGSFTDMPVAYSPDGQTLAVRWDLWRLIDGTRLTQLEQALLQEDSSWPASVVFSPDGKILAAGLNTGGLQLWDLANYQLLRKLDGYTGEVSSLVYSLDGERLAGVFTYPDFTVQVWQASDGKRLLTMKGSYFERVTFSPNGATLGTLAVSNQYGWSEVIPAGNVQLWDAESGAALLKLQAENATSLAFSSNGQIVATGSYSGDVQLWQVSDGHLLKTLKGHSGPIKEVAFSPDGSRLASGGEDGTVVLWGIQGK